jgi:hypothetical protein
VHACQVLLASLCKPRRLKSSLHHLSACRCLKRAAHEAELSISPSAPDVSEACLAEVHTFYVTRSADVRLDSKLLSHCVSDIYTHCRNVTEPAGAFMCLKRHKARLQTRCKAVVSQRQIDTAEHAQLDPQLAASCAAEIKGICGDVGWTPGALSSCLISHMWRSSQGRLEGACRQEVFRCAAWAWCTQRLACAARAHGQSCLCVLYECRTCSPPS